MGYGDFKYLTRRTVSDKILDEKASNSAKNPKEVLLQGLKKVVYNSGSDIKNEIISNKELVEELHKPIIRKI